MIQPLSSRWQTNLAKKIMLRFDKRKKKLRTLCEYEWVKMMMFLALGFLLRIMLAIRSDYIHSNGLFKTEQHQKKSGLIVIWNMMKKGRTVKLVSIIILPNAKRFQVYLWACRHVRIACDQLISSHTIIKVYIHFR